MASSASPPPIDPDRLHGWKEISAFVGKGLRTVQRWEKQHGLPVRRLGDGSDIVFASRREIDAWLAEMSARPTNRVHDPELPPAGPAPAPGDAGSTTDVVGAPRGLLAEPPDVDRGLSPSPPPVPMVAARSNEWKLRGAGVVTFLSITALLAAGGLPWNSSRDTGQVAPVRAGLGSVVTGPPATRSSLQPDSWTVDDRTLHVLDAAGHELWTEAFGGRLSRSAYGPHEPYKVAISDVDGDGNREVLFVLQSASSYPHGTGLFALNADGSTRFEYTTSPTFHFGSATYGPPWPVQYAFLTPSGPVAQDIWAVAFHSPFFPSTLEHLDAATGRVLSTYVSAGYIHIVRRVTWRGHPYVAVGGVNNEFSAGGLALFPADDVRGASPAEKDKYRCSDCPPGSPEEFLVFPRSCQLEASGQSRYPVVQSVETDDRGNLRVGVKQSPDMPGTMAPPPVGFVIYTFAPDGRLIGMDASEGLVDRHRLMHRAGAVDHEMGPADERWLLPVRRWDGARFVDVNRTGFTY